MNRQYQNSGKEKLQIKEELGDQYNFYPASVWSYYIGKDLLYRNIYLYIYFKESVAQKTEIKNIMEKSENTPKTRCLSLRMTQT